MTGQLNDSEQRGRVERVEARGGYDRWAASYDATANITVALDERETPALLDLRPGQRVLDAGCGTGRYFPRLLAAGCRLVGMDFSAGMLAEAHRKHPAVPLLLADLQRPWPLCNGCFDAVFCGLVGEHLRALHAFFAEMRRVLRPGGAAVFSVYHPAMAQAGVEAHFSQSGVEYRLGAERHTLDEYAAALQGAGFAATERREFAGDEALARQFPAAHKRIGFPMLAVFRARAG